MDQIKQRDRKVFLKTLLSPGRILGLLALGMFPFAAFTGAFSDGSEVMIPVGLCVGGMLWVVYNAYQRSIPRRWHNPRFRELYRACLDRHQRLKTALKDLKRHEIADLQELPVSADKLLQDLYVALRRADLVYEEVIRSEVQTAPPITGVKGRRISDAQAQELFRVADKNIAEYSHHFKRVIAGVERAEAQAAVFATTLDTLRVRMLGYRLIKESPESDTQEFLEVVTEAKMQFEAIDKALEEIELTPFPETISVMPEEARRAQEELDSILPPTPSHAMRENLDTTLKTPPPIPPQAQPENHKEQS